MWEQVRDRFLNLKFSLKMLSVISSVTFCVSYFTPSQGLAFHKGFNPINSNLKFESQLFHPDDNTEMNANWISFQELFFTPFQIKKNELHTANTELLTALQQDYFSELTLTDLYFEKYAFWQLVASKTVGFQGRFDTGDPSLFLPFILKLKYANTIKVPLQNNDGTLFVYGQLEFTTNLSVIVHTSSYNYESLTSRLTHQMSFNYFHNIPHSVFPALPESGWLSGSSKFSQLREFLKPYENIDDFTFAQDLVQPSLEDYFNSPANTVFTLKLFERATDWSHVSFN